MAQFVLYHASCRQSCSAETSYFEKHLSEFLPWGKIGVLGLNGAGKSTLLRIMAGIDKDIEGEARPQPDIKIGYLPQEPQLNPEHTVRESIEEAVSEVVNALKRLDEVYALYADPDADFDKLAAEQGRLEEIIQAHDGHNLNVQLERAADALRLPDWDAKIANLSGGEASSRGVVPPAAGKTRHAAARRTDQPPGCGIRGVAGTLPARLRRHRGGDYPRPLLPR